MKRFAPLIVLLGGAVWGTLGLFARQLLAAGLGSVEVAFVRMSVAFLTVGIWLLLFKPGLLKVKWKDLWCFVGAGVGSTLLFSLCYFQALQHTSLAVASVLLYTAPAHVLLLSAVLFGDKLTSRKIAALVIAFSGYVLVSGVGKDTTASVTGILLSLGAGFFYALYSIFGKVALKRGYHAMTLTCYSFMFCVLGCAFFADFSLITQAYHADTGILFWFIGTGIVTAFVPYVLYSLGLQYMEPGVASILSSMELVVEAVTGFAVFQECLSPGNIVGIVLVLLAIILLNLPQKKSNLSQ